MTGGLSAEERAEIKRISAEVRTIASLFLIMKGKMEAYDKSLKDINQKLEMLPSIKGTLNEIEYGVNKKNG